MKITKYAPYILNIIVCKIHWSVIITSVCQKKSHELSERPSYQMSINSAACQTQAIQETTEIKQIGRQTARCKIRRPIEI